MGMALDLVNTIMMPDLVIRVQSLAKVEEVISSVQMGRLLDLASTTLKIYGLVKVAALVHTIQETNSIVQKGLVSNKDNPGPGQYSYGAGGYGPSYSMGSKLGDKDDNW